MIRFLDLHSQYLSIKTDIDARGLEWQDKA